MTDEDITGLVCVNDWSSKLIGRGVNDVGPSNESCAGLVCVNEKSRGLDGVDVSVGDK